MVKSKAEVYSVKLYKRCKATPPTRLERQTRLFPRPTHTLRFDNTDKMSKRPAKPRPGGPKGGSDDDREESLQAVVCTYRAGFKCHGTDTHPHRC